MNTQLRNITIVFISLLFIANIGNTAYLDYVIFVQQSQLEDIKKSYESIKNDLALSERNFLEIPKQAEICPSDCLNQIAQATSSTDSQEKSQVLPTTTQPEFTPAPFAKELYIPLGTGSTTNNEWEDISGSESYIDTANYTTIKKVIFEAGIRVTSNGTVFVRLFNVTDKHPVWFSEISTSQGTSTRVTSEHITLDVGNKLYRVQMKSSLQFPAYFDIARIKIVLQ